MSAIQLNEQALGEIELPSFRNDARRFQVPNFLGFYEVEVILRPEGASHTRPAEAVRKPSRGECAEVLGELFRQMMIPAGRRSGTLPKVVRFPHGISSEAMDQGPDFAGAWNIYRQQLAETKAIEIPAWGDLDTEVQEAFASGGWHLIEGLPSGTKSAEVEGRVG